MPDAGVHCRQHVALNMPVAIGKKDAADSTHIRLDSLSPRRSRFRLPHFSRLFTKRSLVGRENGSDSLFYYHLSPQDRARTVQLNSALNLNKTAATENQMFVGTPGRSLPVDELGIACQRILPPRLPALS